MAKKEKEKENKGEVTKPSSLVNKIAEALGDPMVIMDANSVPRMETPFMFLNKFCKGGDPVGRTIVTCGEYSSGKSTVALMKIAHRHRIDPLSRALVIDSETSFDMEYAIHLGCDPSRIDVLITDDVEKAFNMVFMACTDMDKFSKEFDKNIMKHNYDYVVIDSLDALGVTEDRNSEEFGNNRMGLRAKVIGNCLRKVNSALYHSKTTLNIISQLRDQIGWGTGGKSMNGGNALKYYATVILDLSPTATIYSSGTGDDKEALGKYVKFFLRKNKVGWEKKSHVTRYMFGEQFDLGYDILVYALKSGAIQKSGSWFSYIDGQDAAGKIKYQSFAQGENAACTYINDNPEFAEMLIQHIQDASKLGI